MIKLELLAFGRVFRVALSPQCPRGAVCCAGVLLVDAGCLSLSAYGRRMVWL